MKTHEALGNLLHSVRYQATEAGRSDEGRLLSILATKLEEAELWARIKTPGSHSSLSNPNMASE